jgi:lipoprotein-anchoring transpeptidase ErfK/SrfK
LCLAFSGKSVLASEVADTVKRSAYVDIAKKELVLQFENFSKNGDYTYAVISKDGVIDNGKAVAGQKMHYPLKEFYKINKPYKIRITSEANETLTVYFYTGYGLQNYRASQMSKNIKQSWTVRDKKLYDGYYAQIFRQNALSAEITKPLVAGTKSVTTPASALGTGEYEARLVAIKRANNRVYYGQGFNVPLTYVKLPSAVTGIKAVPDTRRVSLTWNAVAGANYYRVYKSTSASGKYSLAQDKLVTTAATVTGLAGGEKYYFKIAAVSVHGNKSVLGPLSTVTAAKVPHVAGKVDGVKATLDSSDKLYLKWDKTKYAYGYYVYYKKHADKDYIKLCGTRKTKILLDALTEDTYYDLVVYGVSKQGTTKYVSNIPSKVVTLNPKRDLDKVLAGSVRTIGFVGRRREIYTTKKYPTRVKTAFVNTKGYSSPTKYLIWISQYTQQVSIFQGTKGNWKMIRTFTVATGRAWTRSPRGVFHIGRKERGWYYNNTKILYVTHYKGENSFHTRPLYYSGGVATKTLGRPASHGCIRCPTNDAKFIYKHMPRNTTVVSW